jgi:hypothetical protein
LEQHKGEREKKLSELRSLNCTIDNLERRIVDLERKVTLEKYKPQLEGLVDKYIDHMFVPYPYDLSKRLATRATTFNTFEQMLDWFKDLKSNGDLIYLYKISEPTEMVNYYWASCIYFKEQTL